LVPSVAESDVLGAWNVLVGELASLLIQLAADSGRSIFGSESAGNFIDNEMVCHVDAESGNVGLVFFCDVRQQESCNKRCRDLAE